MLDERTELLVLLLEEEGLQDGSSGIQRRDPYSLTAPLSFAQRRLWFFNKLDPESPAYNMAGAVRLVGDVDFPVLSRALSEILRRHEILRTTFAELDGEPVQVIGPATEIVIPIVKLHDLAHVAPEERDSTIARLRRDDAARLFNLETGPLIRVRALALGPAEHLLLVTMHHIVSDGWSLGVLVHEVSALYTAFLAANPSPLGELDFQYADFALWERSEFEKRAFAEQLAYWKGQLVHEPRPLPLPFDRPRPETPSAPGKRLAFSLPTDVVARLNALGARENASLYMVMLAGFITLLHRYTVPPDGSVNDILVGSPVANRNRPGLEGLIGFFVNTLVIRALVERHMPFIDLLRSLRSTCLDAYANQDVPFDKLVEELAPARGLHFTPFFQAVFAFQNLPSPALRFPGVEVEVLETDSGGVRFDLVFDIKERSGNFELIVTYRSALFDDSTIDRICGHYIELLTSIPESAAQPISQLRLLTRFEERRIRDEWNNTDAPFPNVCLHELFEAQAQRDPQAPAIVFEDEALRYSEVEALASGFAARLQSLGVRTGAVVALMAERSLHLVPAILAILKAGGVYVPVDPEYPADRIRFLLEESRAQVLMTQTRFADRLSASVLPRIFIDEIQLGAETGYRAADVCPEDLAYIIFTSGSTGEPKGVMIPHRGIVNRVFWNAQLLKIGPGDRILHKTPLAFDVSIGEMFLPLAAGAALVVAAPGKHWDPEYLAAIVEQNSVTFAHFVPSMLRVSSKLLTSVTGPRP